MQLPPIPPNPHPRHQQRHPYHPTPHTRHQHIIKPLHHRRRLIQTLPLAHRITAITRAVIRDIELPVVWRHLELAGIEVGDVQAFGWVVCEPDLDGLGRVLDGVGPLEV